MDIENLNNDWWNSLMPYLSLRLFDLPEQSWSENILALVQQFSTTLPFFIQKLPRTTKVTANLGRPQSLNLLGTMVFPVNEFSLVPAPLDKVKPETLTDNHVSLTAACFKIDSYPSWLKAGSPFAEHLKDVKYHLLLFIVQPPYAAITCTHESTQNFLYNVLREGQLETVHLPAPLSPVKRTHMENAFVNGEAYHLWLKGNHRKTLTKPDLKTLDGSDVRYVIDPFGDQSFNYSAVISRLNTDSILKTPLILDEEGKRISRVGYSRSTGAIWVAKTKGLLEFGQTFNLLRKMIQAAESKTAEEINKFFSEQTGFNLLTQPVAPQAIANAKEPFEVGLDLDEPTIEHTDNAYQKLQEDWRNYGLLEIDKNRLVKNTEDYLTIPVLARYRGDIIGSFNIEIKMSVESDFAIITKEWVSLDDSEAKINAFDLLFDLISYKTTDNAFNIRFETGHVLTGRYLYKQQYTDFLFEQWKPVYLKKHSLSGLERDYDASAEKPGSWLTVSSREKRCTEIKRGNSLFSRVANDVKMLFQPTEDNEWYLLCHDQANEIADFIYIEPDARRIDLVHVKGANSNSDNREISIDAYQVVCAQAVKNLRHLNIEELRERFATDNPTECGQFMVAYARPEHIEKDCSSFITALNKMADGFPPINKRVVVFQPHVTTAYWQSKAKKLYLENKGLTTNATLRKAFMLSTLLIETEITCKKQGAKFEVWCEDNTQPAVP